MTTTTTLKLGANTEIPQGPITVEASEGVLISALILSDDLKVAGDPDMVFHNFEDGKGVTWKGNVVTTELNRLRPDAVRVVILGSPIQDEVTFGSLPAPTVTVRVGTTEVTFTVEGLSTETALNLCELYVRNGAPRVKAIGQGYDDGLAGIARDFGVDVTEDEPEAPAAPAAPVQAPEPAKQESKPIGMVKIKRHETLTMPISLDKKKAAATVFTCHLDWDGGSASRRSKGADLEWYADVVLKDGSTHTVYWNHLGILTGRPWALHHGDSKVPGRETISITNPDEIAHVGFYAYSAVKNGRGSFFSYGAKAVIDDGQGSTITVPLFDKSEKYWVFIAKMHFVDGGVKVEQVEDYGFTTEARPVLHADGSHTMGAGPTEFKP